MDDDRKNLKLLSIFHYIAGALTALIFFFPFIYVLMGIAMLAGVVKDDEVPAAILGIVFIAFGGFMLLAGWGLALAMLTAADRLRKCQSHRFCLIVAGVECLLMPYGTVLGVFTILILMKDSVQKLFHESGGKPNVAAATDAGDNQ